MTWRNGWGVTNAQYSYAPQFVNNKMTVNPVTGASVGYDASGNLTNDGSQSYSYDATGQQTYASGGGSAPAFTDDPLNDPNNPQRTEIKLVHLTELRVAVDQLRARAGLPAASWTTDPNPQQFVTLVHHDHILQLRARLEEALSALHQPTGGYAHSTINNGDPIYAIDFQELRNQIKAVECPGARHLAVLRWRPAAWEEE
jgi:hypothetical protein